MKQMLTLTIGANSRRRWNLPSKVVRDSMLLLNLLILGSCSSDSPPQPHSSKPGTWAYLGLKSPSIHQVVSGEGKLVVALGSDGVAIQEPAVIGAWQIVPAPSSESGEVGRVASVLVRDGAIYAALSRRVAGLPGTLYVLVEESLTWDAVLPETFDDGIWDLCQAPDGAILASISTHGILRSGDLATWNLAWDGPIQNTRFLANPTFAAGWNLFATPLLLASSDNGIAWTNTQVHEATGFSGDGVVSTVSTTQSELVITINERVYASSDSGLSFKLLLSVDGVVHAVGDPTVSGRVLAFADSMYTTRDGGETWSSTAPPFGDSFFTRSNHDGRALLPLWNDSFLIVPVVDETTGQKYLYCADTREL